MIFRRFRGYLRCVFTGECPLDMPTTNTTIVELREQEVAATAAADVMRSQREAMEPTRVNELYDRITGNRNGVARG